MRNLKYENEKFTITARDGFKNSLKNYLIQFVPMITPREPLPNGEIKNVRQPFNVLQWTCLSGSFFLDLLFFIWGEGGLNL